MKYTQNIKYPCNKVIRLSRSNDVEKSKKPNYAYFGARYYASDESVWLSVVPIAIGTLASKYPSMSPFMYTAGNPVILVDPDGIAFRPLNPETAQLFREAGKSIFKKQEIYDHFVKTSVKGNFYTRKENLTYKQFKKELKAANKNLAKSERVRFTKQEKKDAFAFYSKVDAKRLDDIVLLSANSTNKNSDFYNENQLTNTARSGITSNGISNVAAGIQAIENFVEDVTPNISDKFGQSQNIKTK